MKQKIENFIVFYHSQDLQKRREIRDEFLSRSGLSYPSWGSKLTRKKFSPLEIDALESICNLSFQTVQCKGDQE